MSLHYCHYTAVTVKGDVRCSESGVGGRFDMLCGHACGVHAPNSQKRVPQRLYSTREDLSDSLLCWVPRSFPFKLLSTMTRFHIYSGYYWVILYSFRNLRVD
ncbi:hypothetical protein E2C01_061446 [Portunus trituberculatus]|uniref:Uncharacterized protein n=1 Tax=Portunus trituberculatus TaxID=210409 RepID=A0A5B7HAZ0_PORTR|nr:hypothetical protein [Portunus trituberculatus]